jgi:hypothetical protein
MQKLFSPQPKNKKFPYVQTTIEDKNKNYNKFLNENQISDEFKEYLKNVIKKEFEILFGQFKKTTEENIKNSFSNYSNNINAEINKLNLSNDYKYKKLNDELNEEKVKITSLMFDVNNIKMSNNNIDYNIKSNTLNYQDFSNKITEINNKLKIYKDKINNLINIFNNFHEEFVKLKANLNDENKKNQRGCLYLYRNNVALLSIQNTDKNPNDNKKKYNELKVIYEKNAIKTKKLNIELNNNLNKEQMLINQKYIKNNQIIFNNENDINNSIFLKIDKIPSSIEDIKYSTEFNITLKDNNESNSDNEKDPRKSESFISNSLENSVDDEIILNEIK